MHRWLGIIGLCLALAGCALESPIPSTGYLPQDAFGNAAIGQDPAITATQTATFAFAHPAAMQGEPARMALAIASLDAMAGQFSTVGRWSGMNGLAQLEMLEARKRVREILGISPDLPSQTVIDALVAASHALDRDDRPAAERALTGPGFAMLADRMLALLTHFPAVPIANRATQLASQYLHPQGGGPFGGDRF
jgi:hypothetical protein